MIPVVQGPAVAVVLVDPGRVQVQVDRGHPGQRWDAEGSPASELRAGQEAAPPLRRVPAAVAGGDLYVDPR